MSKKLTIKFNFANQNQKYRFKALHETIMVPYNCSLTAIGFGHRSAIIELINPGEQEMVCLCLPKYEGHVCIRFGIPSRNMYDVVEGELLSYEETPPPSLPSPPPSVLSLPCTR